MSEKSEAEYWYKKRVAEVILAFCRVLVIIGTVPMLVVSFLAGLVMFVVTVPVWVPLIIYKKTRVPIWEAVKQLSRMD